MSSRVRHTNEEIANRNHMLPIAEQRAFAMWASAGGRPSDREYHWLPTWYCMSVQNSTGRTPPKGECYAFAHGVVTGLKERCLMSDRPTAKELAWRTGTAHPQRVAKWFGDHGNMPLDVLCMLALWYQVSVRDLLSTYGAPAAQRWREEHAEELAQHTLRPVVDFPEDAPQNLVAVAAEVAHGMPTPPQTLPCA